MKRSRKKFTLFLILILITLSPSTLAELVTNPDLSCLKREQKEKLEICFQQNESCHKELSYLSDPPYPWGLLIGTSLGSILLGLVLATQHR